MPLQPYKEVGWYPYNHALMVCTPKDGLLEVVLPKSEQAKAAQPRKIEVK